MRRGFGFHDRHSPFRFNPATLFAAGAPGAWYDPSDLTTLFQDSAGTTPVTASGQAVGMMLDKSKGLVLGPELIANGGPFVNTTGWTGNQATLSVSGGFLVGTLTGANEVGPYQDVTVVAGRSYLISAVINPVSTNNGGRLRITDAPWSNGVYSATVPVGSSLTVQCVFRPASTTIRVSIASLNGAAIGQIIRANNISVRELAGNHAFSTSSGSRPTYTVSSGLSYLTLDGSDDSMLTNAIDFTGTNKMTVWAGLLKSSDAAQGVVAELSATIASNNGSFLLSAPNSAAANYNWSSKGTTQVDNTVTTYAAPNTAVLTGQADIAGPSNIIRVNGAQAGSVATTQGTGNFGNYALNIGRRNNASLPFNGRLYGLIVLGAAASDWQVYVTEQWMAGKTGLQF